MKRFPLNNARRTKLAGRCLFLAAAFVACDDDSLEPPRECNAPMPVTVSAGTTPSFTWTVACAVARLVVLNAPTVGQAQVMWDVRSDPSNIVSPVQYGQRPGGASEAVPPVALQAGQTYQVRVFTAAQVAVASTTFVP